MKNEILNMKIKKYILYIIIIYEKSKGGDRRKKKAIKQSCKIEKLSFCKIK